MAMKNAQKLPGKNSRDKKSYSYGVLSVKNENFLLNMILAILNQFKLQLLIKTFKYKLLTDVQRNRTLLSCQGCWITRVDGLRKLLGHHGNWVTTVAGLPGQGCWVTILIYSVKRGKTIYRLFWYFRGLHHIIKSKNAARLGTFPCCQ